MPVVRNSDPRKQGPYVRPRRQRQKGRRPSKRWNERKQKCVGAEQQFICLKLHAKKFNGRDAHCRAQRASLPDRPPAPSSPPLLRRPPSPPSSGKVTRNPDWHSFPFSSTNK